MSPPVATTVRSRAEPRASTPASSPAVYGSSSRMTRPLLLIAVAVASLAFAIWGAERGVAASVGAALSVGNWLALRWLVGRMFEGQGANRAGLGLLLVGKIGLLIAIVFVLISRVQLDPIGLAFGLGVLFVGPALAGLLANVSNNSLNPSAAAPAREER